MGKKILQVDYQGLRGDVGKKILQVDYQGLRGSSSWNHNAIMLHRVTLCYITVCYAKMVVASILTFLWLCYKLRATSSTAMLRQNGCNITVDEEALSF